ncbi:MAG: MFS transporter, partial [Bdellovibrionales bacterium]|nr:MFS transporter [Bdellovibrionales bacterium]
LPELLRDDELSRGNGYLELWTFIPIIAGTALAGQLLHVSDSHLLLPALVVVGVALAGLGASFCIAETPPAGSQAKFPLNPLRDIARAIDDIRRHRGLFLVLLAIAFFWFIGNLFQVNILLYAKTMLGLKEVGTSLLLAVLGVGIGVGSVAAGVVSAGKVELGLVPLGAIGISSMCLLLSVSHSSMSLTTLALFGLGISAGFYVVPLNAYLQRESPAMLRGRYIATSNFLAYAAMLVASALIWLTHDVLHIGSTGVFFGVGILSVAATVMACRELPEMLVRCVNWIVSHFIYRVRVIGSQHVPKSGAALLVANHVSFVDAPLILAALDRSVRFLMYRPLSESRLFHPIAKRMGVIPIDGADGRDGVRQSLDVAREALRNGELVGIFAEGGITRTGLLGPFKRGLESIMEDGNAPIIPVYLDQMWGSVFSFSKGRFLWKRPREWPYRMTIVFGEPLPATSRAEEVREAVQLLSMEAVAARDDASQFLAQSMVRSAKRRGKRLMVADASGERLSGYAFLARAYAGAYALRRAAPTSNQVGIMGEQNVATAVDHAAVALAGRVGVVLDPALPIAELRELLERCDIHEVIVIGDSPVEGGFRRISWGELCGAPPGLLLAGTVRLLPASVLLSRLAHEKGDPFDRVTVLFSAGPSGAGRRRAVRLSHANISANISSLSELLGLDSSDHIVAALPFHDAFGYVAALWLPLCRGVPVTLSAPMN